MVIRWVTDIAGPWSCAGTVICRLPCIALLDVPHLVVSTGNWKREYFCPVMLCYEGLLMSSPYIVASLLCWPRILQECVMILVSFLVSAFVHSLDQSYTHPTRIMERPVPEVQLVVPIIAMSCCRRATGCQYHFVAIFELICLIGAFIWRKG